MNVPEPTSLLDRAMRCLVVLLLALSPPSSPTVITSQGDVGPTDLIAHSTSPATQEATVPDNTGCEVDAAQAHAWCTHARYELEAARRLLEVMRTDSAPEVERYLHALATALTLDADAGLDLHALPALTDDLRSARETLLNDAATHTRWVNLARALQNDPEACQALPERFVSRTAPAPDGLLPLAPDQRLILRGGLLVLDAPLTADDLAALQAETPRDTATEDPPHGAS